METLIPAHPQLVDLAISALNEIAHVVREREDNEGRESRGGTDGEGDSQGSEQLNSNFMPNRRIRENRRNTCVSLTIAVIF